MLAVAAEATVLEELGGDGAGQGIRAGAVDGALADGFGDEVELPREGVGIHAVVSEAGDGDGPAEEVDLVVVASDRLGKIALGGAFHRGPQNRRAGTTDQRSGGAGAHRGRHR